MSLEKILKFLLGLFLFLLPWQTIWIFREVFVGGIKSEYSTLGFYATDALLWVIILCFIIFYFRKLQITNYKLQDFKWTKDRIFVLAVLSLISYLFLSMSWSRDPSLALQQSLRVMEAFLLFFILWLGPLKKEEAIRWLVFGSILPCVLGIWQFLTQSTFASTLLGLASHQAWEAGTSVVASDTVGRWLRAYGPFAHPNVFGGYIVIVLTCLVMEHGIWNMEYGTKSKIVFHVVCSMLCVVLFFTFSRSAWLAAAVVITYHLSRITYQRSRVACYVVCVMCYVFLVTLFFPLVQTRFSGDSILETRSISDRVSGYSEAWKIFKRNPVFGVGAGNYTVAAWHLDKWRPAWQIQPAHNVFVLFAVEGGVVGVGLLVIVILIWIMDHGSWIKNKAQFGRCSMFNVLCFVTLAFADHYLYSSYAGLMLSAIFFGLISRRNVENTVSPQLVHRDSFDTQSTACHNTDTRLRPPLADYGESKKEPTVGAGA